MTNQKHPFDPFFEGGFESGFKGTKPTKPDKIKKPELQGDIEVWEEFFKKDEEEEEES